MVWHGGEPLTAGIEKFKDILSIEEKLKVKYGAEFMNSVQTNGTLINDDFATFFKANNFIVGFSLDGPKSIQDLNRYNKMVNHHLKQLCEEYKLSKKKAFMLMQSV